MPQKLSQQPRTREAPDGRTGPRRRGHRVYGLVGAAACTGALLAMSVPAVSAAPADDLSGLSAQEIADKAKAELLDASSLRLELDQKAVGEGRTIDLEGPVSMDLALDDEGNCAGDVELGVDDGVVEIIKRGEEVWLKPDRKFWESQIPDGQGDTAAELFKNRYVHGTTDDSLLKELTDTCDLSTLQKEIRDDADDTTDELTKGKETSVDGTRAVPLTRTEGDRRMTLYVAAEGPPYLIRATELSDEAHLTMDFKDYDKPVPSATPSDDESIDVSKLQQNLRRL